MLLGQMKSVQIGDCFLTLVYHFGKYQVVVKTGTYQIEMPMRDTVGKACDDFDDQLAKLNN